jgi:hypothetical protein
MPVRPERIAISLSLPPDHEERLELLAHQRGVEVGLLLREWIAAELVRWIPDEAREIQRSPSFREIRFGAALRELRRIESEYGPDIPGLRRCIKQLQESISRVRAQMASG